LLKCQRLELKGESVQRVHWWFIYRNNDDEWAKYTLRKCGKQTWLL